MVLNDVTRFLVRQLVFPHAQPVSILLGCLWHLRSQSLLFRLRRKARVAVRRFRRLQRRYLQIFRFSLAIRLRNNFFEPELVFHCPLLDQACIVRLSC